MHAYRSLAESDDPDAASAAADARTAEIAGHFRAIMRALGLDLEDPELAATPERVAHLYLELFPPAGAAAQPAIATFPNRERSSQMIALRDISFYSVCAHQFLPFFGRAHLAYIPGERLVGLGELARVVEFYARRPQLQERLTGQILECLASELRPQGAMVLLQASHLCLEMRGVRKPGTLVTTSAVHGLFEDRAVREEFLQLLHRGV